MQVENNQTSRKRRVNFRFFLFTAICIVVAILFAYLYFVNVFLSVLCIVVFAILLFCLFVISLRRERKTVKVVAFAAALILSVVAYACFVLETVNWQDKNFISGKVYSVSGSVDSNIVHNGNRIIVIDNLTFGGDMVSGKLRIYLSETEGHMEFAREGDSLSFSAKVTLTDIYNNYRKNQRYYASVKQSDISLNFGKPSLLQSIRIKIRQILKDNLSDTHAETAYSMLTGDKNHLPLETADYFRGSGLSHLLAVSGLHIGFVMMLLLTPLRKIRANKKLIFIVVTIFLLGYAVIADFSPSVMRAIIMAIVGLATSLSGRPRDTLNNLCLAVTLILTAKPHFLFDVGFLLSVSAVLGIIFFAPPIAKLLKRLKFPKFLANSISIIVSAQLGIMPVALLFFKSFYIYSIGLNIVLVHIIAATFMLLFAGVLLAYFLPFMGFVIKIAGLGMLVIDRSAQFVSNLPFAHMVIYTMLPILVCYLIYFVASRFFRKGKAPTLISAICMVVCLVLTLSFNFSYSIKNTITPVSTAYYDVTSVVTVGSSVYVIGDLASSYDVKKTLVSIRARKIDAIFISRLNEKTANQLINLSYSYKGFTVYVPLVQSISGLLMLMEKMDVSVFEESGQINGKIHAEFSGDKFLCYRMENDTTALFVPQSIDISKIPSALKADASIIRSSGQVYGFGGITLTNLPSEENLYANEIPMHQTKSTVYNYKTGKTKTVKIYD